jgi:hypothetical protein
VLPLSDLSTGELECLRDEGDPIPSMTSCHDADLMGLAPRIIQIHVNSRCKLLNTFHCRVGPSLLCQTVSGTLRPRAFATSCIELVKFAPFYPASLNQSPNRSEFGRISRPQPYLAFRSKASRTVARCITDHTAFPITAQQNDALYH